MEREARQILNTFREYQRGAGECVNLNELGDALPLNEAGWIQEGRVRRAFEYLLHEGCVIEHLASLELTQKGYDLLLAWPVDDA